MIHTVVILLQALLYPMIRKVSIFSTRLLKIQPGYGVTVPTDKCVFQLWYSIVCKGQLWSWLCWKCGFCYYTVRFETSWKFRTFNTAVYSLSLCIKLLKFICSWRHYKNRIILRVLQTRLLIKLLFVGPPVANPSIVSLQTIQKHAKSHKLAEVCTVHKNPELIQRRVWLR